MKRLLVFLTLAFCLNMLNAQQPAICGDWVERQQENSYDKYGRIANIVHINVIIRIKYSDSHYFVFEKVQREDNVGVNFINYLATGSVMSACKDSISWKRRLISYDGDKKSVEEEYKKAVFANGVLNVSEYTITNYYDQQGNIANTKKSKQHTTTYYRYDQDW